MIVMKNVVLCTDFKADIEAAVERCEHDKVFVLTDVHTEKLCLPLLLGSLDDFQTIVVGAEDLNKDIQTLASVWNFLSEKGASRHSLLINLGGGMITDLGGFAASTFKRGINYINVPTTLLAMVDASVGGKTGINFNGLKNEIGVFNAANYVLINTDFLRTLDHYNILSGYAEMLKHGLIDSVSHWAELLNFEINDIDYVLMKELVGQNIQVKQEIVAQDPNEKGIRKALNFGHTFGHAFESLALARQKPILHGYAVAYGMVCELYMSCVKSGFPKDKMRQTIHFIKENYGLFSFGCDDYDHLYQLMLHDKKNENDVINFTLLEDVGKIQINQQADRKTIEEVLDFYRECME
jgi:3-dehydroquinate synthetase